MPKKKASSVNVSTRRASAGSSKPAAKKLIKEPAKSAGKKPAKRLPPLERARKLGISVRPATRNDIDQIVALNILAYPTLAEENVVWSPRHVQSHLENFPDGQMVAVRDGRVVGASSSLIVSFGRDPFRNHTWNGITDSGMFYNHNPYGDTLYGADVCVHPEERGSGVGAMLYEARRELAKKLNLRRIVLGGRLWNYRDHAHEMSAEEYASRVAVGDLKDLVLSFQIREGFVLRRVMPNYLPDPHSLNHATFMEWINPDYRKPKRRSRSARVSCVQYSMRKIGSFDDFAQQVSYFVDVARNYESDFVLFPELLTAQLMSFIKVKTPQEAIRRLTKYTERLDKLLTSLAARYQTTIIGGSHPVDMGDHIENIASLYLPDGTVHRQPKLHITPNERRWWGITGGNKLQVFQTPICKIGILICYDSEFPEAARYLADQGAEIIFVPFCTDDRQGYLRVRYCCQARAVENQVYVAIAGTVGNLPDTENMDIQYAQAAVFSPSDFLFARDGILVEANPNTETVITTDLDLEALQEAINEGSVRQRRDRRPDLFQYRALFDEPQG